ncbi:MAG: flagellar biosynthesis protein FlhF [Armatimonadetes bacterium]|nr:flagellar biosynthesis protein FlhF [Armatimonadota bacterium]MDW8027455.1 flagellar biosynthesis protein FlhF [Armatimonadota bacterium]
MIVRCFEGRSMPEVMEQVRREMGEDAVILHTQQKRGLFRWLRKNPMVRVWAATATTPKVTMSDKVTQLSKERSVKAKVETDDATNFASDLPTSEPSERNNEEAKGADRIETTVKGQELVGSRKNKKRSKRSEGSNKTDAETPTRTSRNGSRKTRQTDDEFAEIVIRVERQLQLLAASLWGKDTPVLQSGFIGLLWQCGVDLTTIQRLFASNLPAPDEGVPNEEWLKSILKRNLPVTGGLAPKTSVAVLVGPTGVGKTTTVAKIAANELIRQKKRVALITVDVFRIGAVQQLETYARLMGLPFFVATNPEEAQKCIRQAKQIADLSIIDTIGRSPKHTEQITALWELVAAMNPDEVLLTLPANGNPSDLALAADQFSVFCPTSLIITKLDEATQTGVIVNLVTRLNLPVSYITTGQNVPEDLEVPTSDRLAEWVISPIKDRREVFRGLAKEVARNA